MDGRPFNLRVISLTPLVKSHDVKKIVMHAGLPVRSTATPFFGSSGSGVHESDPAVIR